MTRRWFFQALAGATALVGAAKRLVAKSTTVTVGFPTVLRKGDRLSVSFSHTSSDILRMVPIVTLAVSTRNPNDVQVNHVSLPSQAIFIATSLCVVTGVQVFYGIPPSEPAPILWTKTSAGQ